MKDMKKVLLLLLLFGLQSCNTAEIESLQKQNDALIEENRELASQLYRRSQTKYVYSVVYYRSGIISVSSHGSRIINAENHIYFSQIEEIIGYDNSVKYRLQDDLENQLRTFNSSSLESIQNRETFAFNTYEEASQHRYNLVNN